MRKIVLPFLGLSTLVLFLSSCQQGESYYSYPDVVDETYVHRYGVPVSAAEWNAGGNHGQIVTTLANGVIVTKSYESGILDGDTTYSYPHSSSIEKVETYMNGILQKEMAYYMSGAPKNEVIYNTPQNRSISSWYESGALKSKEQFHGNLLFQAAYYDQNNQIDSQIVDYDGTRTTRDDYGQRVSIDNISKGLMTLRTTYHPNGAPKEITPYANGVPHGLVKSFFPGGEPCKVESWQHGLQTGLASEFLNGEKVLDCNYAEGKKQGVEHRYRDGKTVVQEISWVNGQKQGPCVTYIGSTNKIEWYWQGKQVSKAAYDLMTCQGKKTIWNNTSDS